MVPLDGHPWMLTESGVDVLVFGEVVTCRHRFQADRKWIQAMVIPAAPSRSTRERLTDSQG